MTGLWSRVVGQDAAVAILRAAVERDQVPHAWLFVGQAGIGQDEAAAALAADLNCPDRDERRRACGTCATCSRIAGGSHGAFLRFEPEGAEHVVASVRDQWIPSATRTLLEGRVRVLRVVEADRMNAAAQNAFLKILEEPPGSVVWILESADPSNLLETIISRTRRLEFAAWTRDDLHRAGEDAGIAPEVLSAFVGASMGSPQRLRELADDDVAVARGRHLAVVGRLVEEGPGAAVVIAKEITAWSKSRVAAKKDELEEELNRLEEAYAGEWPPGVKTRVQKRLERRQREERRHALHTALDDLASYLRDIIAVHAGADPVNSDHTAMLARDARDISPTVAREGLAAISACADALDSQGQPELHLERLLLRIAVALFNERAAG